MSSISLNTCLSYTSWNHKRHVVHELLQKDMFDARKWNDSKEQDRNRNRNVLHRITSKKIRIFKGLIPTKIRFDSKSAEKPCQTWSSIRSFLPLAFYLFVRFSCHLSFTFLSDRCCFVVELFLPAHFHCHSRSDKMVSEPLVEANLEIPL